jgi:hypothetical protein
MLPYSDSMSIHGKPSSYIPPVPGLVVRMKNWLLVKILAGS